MINEGKIWDVIIAGCGPAGCAAAIRLGRSNLSVLLVNQNNSSSFKIGETLPPAANSILSALGVWDEFLRQEHSPSHGISSSWGTADLVHNDYFVGVDGHGWHLDRVAFDSMLLERAQQFHPCIEGMVKDVNREKGNIVVAIQQNHKLSRFRARWILDGTGQKSIVARKLGTQRIFIDNLVCIWSVVKSKTLLDRNSFTIIEATENGWWYSALLPDQHRVVVFASENNAEIMHVMRSVQGFLANINLTRHIKGTLDEYDLSTFLLPEITAAASSKLAQFGGDNWMALGDAAMAFQPLAGFGIANALLTGIESARLIQLDSINPQLQLRLYREFMGNRWDQYQKSLTRSYLMEQRWVEGNFWKKRFGQVDLSTEVILP